MATKVHIFLEVIPATTNVLQYLKSKIPEPTIYYQHSLRSCQTLRTLHDVFRILDSTKLTTFFEKIQEATKDPLEKIPTP